MTYMQWRRRLAHGESVALRHLGHARRWPAPATYDLDDYHQAARCHKRPGRAAVRARREAAA